ncbi:MAG: 4Fe-4S binding protein [Clostridiales bacterium]|nr:4Fe-4S binding protein [Clostridiales bacterium]
MNFQELRDLQPIARKKLDERLAGNPDVEIYGDGYRLSGDYFRRQTRVVLRNSDIIDPLNIEEYIAMDGYRALADILEKEISPANVVETMIEAKLRGRGGAGFPAGRKWKEAHDYDAERKYVICNADEGDPGAYMDRHILESDPHAVLEGMAIAAYAIGADYGYIYVRAEYPIAVKRLRAAIAQAEERKLLGDNILGTDFCFHLELRLGAGAFVCGEATAMIESIEGRRGMPRFKRHRTAHKGLFGMPTIVNNVETLANVAGIYRNGPEWFKSIGTAGSPGTKVFALVGKIAEPGLVEVPMGTPLREIIYNIGGGIKDNKKFKAVQTGGPSGGCIPEQFLDIQVDFDELVRIGSIMGSGGMVIMDEDDCMVDIARFFMEFSVEESCGKCTPCRIGNKRILELLNKIIHGDGRERDLDYLKELSLVIRDTSLCGLGQSATNPVLSTLKYFEDEYKAHAIDKKCPAGVCKALKHYYISDACVGCGLCMRNCPTNCISGEPRSKHTINQESCVQCGTCVNVCPVKAIHVE